ncbi:MAG TPA: molybdenum cofactor biosynthesis protein MoaE [Solirubrobacteraceae bacterium]|nr:molybdenum cofactor biosynthesis protein MoaE [Solirubrobacteraceae bacterium]
MRIAIRLFASLRERAGRDVVELDLPEDARVADALAGLGELLDGLPVVLAVNREYAPQDAPLHPGDELALIPPVSGGSTTAVHARVTRSQLRLDPLLDLVRDPRAGAVVTFLGVTRQVSHLDYEAYVEMAEKEMARIVESAMATHGLCAAAAEHRTGEVPLSEASVVVAVSAPHRDAAFAGAREIIDQIKAQAPIWKKEEGEWVAGHPPRPPA